MSTHSHPRSRPRFPLSTSSPQDMKFDREVLDFTHYRPAWNYLGLDLPIQPPTTRFPQVYSGKHLLFPEGTPFPQQTNQMHNYSTSTHVNHRQTQTNPGWTQMPAQMVPPFHSTHSPSIMREARRDDVTPASHPPYHSDLYGTCWSSDIVSNPSWPPRAQPSDGYLFLPHIPQDIRSPSNQFLSGPGAHQSSSHGTYSYSHYPLASATNGQDVAGPSHGLRLAHQPSIPSGLNWRTHSVSSRTFETGLNYRFVPPQEPSRRRQRARAILYCGLWIDLEELLESRKGKLMNVHRCLWEEDRFPCDLWVKSDKSSIRAHIRKWHRGKPGGDKLEVECRWSACGSKTLKESIARHILGAHLGEMWVCQGCEKKSTRKDAYMRHAAKSDFESCQTAGPLTTYSAFTQQIDVHAALDSRGRLRYAGA